MTANITRFVQVRVSTVFLGAPEDGVAPSILLTLQDSKKKPLAQYLYNVPDGSSRLMLEHKARPGLQLRALFLSGCSPAEAGGLGSVVLRLKQDGHANLQLVGPHGKQAQTSQKTEASCQSTCLSQPARGRSVRHTPAATGWQPHQACAAPCSITGV